MREEERNFWENAIIQLRGMQNDYIELENILSENNKEEE